MSWYKALFVFSFCLASSWCSRIKIEDNGYSGIFVALPRNLEEEARAKVVLNVEAMFKSSSDVLQLSTKGRAYFSEVSFLVPDTWHIPEADSDSTWESTAFNFSAFFEAGAALTADEADVVITEDGRYPYVLHHSGCGRRATRIILPKDFLLGEGEKGVTFARLWSEYRYGVFPEGGFKNDERYPLTYSAPGKKEETVTGCSDQRFWISNACDGKDKICTENLTSSLMDQHLPPSAKLFCEGYISLGPHHNPESPSKHNLICKEEGTWFTVMRSPDFASGRNAAPKRLQHASDVSFRFVRETLFPKVVVAIESSSRMAENYRYLLTKSPLYEFFYSTLPDGSELTLFLFGGDEVVKMEKHGIVLKNEESKLSFLESQPLPEDASETENISLEQLFDVMFQTIRNRSDPRTASADIIVVTTESHLNATAYANIKQKISGSESRLHVILFDENGMEESSGKSLYHLCQESGGRFTSLHADAFGDLHRGLRNVMRNSNREVLIMQDYLEEDDDVDLEVSFDLDESLAGNLRVHLSFPFTDNDDLQYKKTMLRTPSGGYLNFLKMGVLDAWVIDVPKPEVGEYVLKTRRMEEEISSVLITVSGSPTASEDPITLNVWTETVPDWEAVPTPVRIFTEVKKGWNPVVGAQVLAEIHHPNGEKSQQMLLDDGLGDVDITKNDGIYGSYFTRFTTPGYYNVHVTVTRGLNGAEVLTGLNGICCGSFFPSANAIPIGNFQREAGPLTFHVPSFEIPSDTHRFPPARVTDLRLGDLIDRICIIHWTAVGEDYDSGFAATYELKVFRDTTVIRNRFSESGQEIYSETITATAEATYGTSLNHAFQLPSDIKIGVYYIAIRAVDESGNAGEPSNAVSVWIKEGSPRSIDCESKEDCENEDCGEMPIAEELRGNIASSLISCVTMFGFVPANLVVPIVSLILSLALLNSL